MSSSNNSGGGFKSIFAAIVIPAAIIVAIGIYMFILGNPANFMENDPNNHPNNYLGIIHKGGNCAYSYQLIINCNHYLYWADVNYWRVKGKSSVDSFVGKIRSLLSNGDLNTAITECDKQKGSIANVVKAGIESYRKMQGESSLDKERKTAAIQKELDEATTLELPMLSKNLVIISTVASVATLMGLLGTVIGMIRAFAALAQAGAPDAIALATGISEALINTALGVGTSALAIIMYNYFTNKIDSLTYGIDEASYSIVQSFTANTK